MRRLVVLIAAVVAASALADGPVFRWEVPRAIASAEVPGEQVALGVPLRLSAVRSQLDAEALFDFFLREFERAELFVTPKTLQFMPPGGLSLTGLDVKRGVSYTVIFQPNPDKTTTVILGEANLARRKREPEAARVPVFPGAKGVLTSKNESASLVTYTASALVPEVAGFYRESLTAAGYTEREGVFSNGREELKISAETTHTRGELFIVVEIRKVSAATGP